MTIADTFYAVRCDNCGKIHKDYSGISFWNDTNGAKEMAGESDWINEEGKDYCDECYYYDDEDNLIIKQVEMSPVVLKDYETCGLCGKRKVKIDGGWEHLCTQKIEK